MGPRYPQHNPMAADGPGGFQCFLQFLRAKYPDSHSEITRLFADGEDVILMISQKIGFNRRVAEGAEETN